MKLSLAVSPIMGKADSEARPERQAVSGRAGVASLVAKLGLFIAILVGAVVPTAKAEIEKNGRLRSQIRGEVIGVAIDAIQFKTELRFPLGGAGENVAIGSPPPQEQPKVANPDGIEGVGVNTKRFGNSRIIGSYIARTRLRHALVLKREPPGQISFEAEERLPVDMIQKLTRARWSRVVPFNGEGPSDIIAPWGSYSAKSFPFYFFVVNIGAQLPLGTVSGVAYQAPSDDNKKESSKGQRTFANSDSPYRSLPSMFLSVAAGVVGMFLFLAGWSRLILAYAFGGFLFRLDLWSLWGRIL
jgi:hypothetical protein